MDSLFDKPHLTAEQSQHLLSDRNLHLASRAIWGISSYVLLWSVLLASALLKVHDPVVLQWLYQATAFIVTVAFFRLYLTHKAREHALSRRLCCFYLHAGVIISAASWGLVASEALTIQALEEFRPIVIGATAGTMVGGAFTLAASRSLWVALLVSTGLPLILTVNSLAMIDATAFNLLFLACFVVCGCVAAQFYSSYHELAVSRLMLEVKAKELAAMVDQDGLTAVFNRRYFDQSLGKELNRASRGNSAISLLLIDLDHFKRVNDTYGHTVGDTVLKEVSSHLMQIFHREIDIVSRYGGEEFAVLLPHTHQQYAHTLAESVRKRIGQLVIQTQKGTVKVSASIGGYSVCPTASTTPEGVVDKADKALYLAKGQGRDRVCFFDDGQVLSDVSRPNVFYPVKLMK